MEKGGCCSSSSCRRFSSSGLLEGCRSSSQSISLTDFFRLATDDDVIDDIWGALRLETSGVLVTTFSLSISSCGLEGGDSWEINLCLGGNGGGVTRFGTMNISLLSLTNPSVRGLLMSVKAAVAERRGILVFSLSV
eukprot:08290.XXX_32155_32562_1 [CDS] Oithona nana genome sequencing.